MAYETAASSWHDFYLIAGAAAAQLIGLLFVALSLHLDVVVSHSDVRGVARVTLANFALLLFVSLFVVIRQSQIGAAAELIGVGLISLAVTTPIVIAAAWRQGRVLRSPRIAMRFGASLAGYLMVIAAGGLLLSSSGAGFTLLAVTTVLLLVISLRNAWDLLVTVGDVKSKLRAESH